MVLVSTIKELDVVQCAVFLNLTWFVPCWLWLSLHTRCGDEGYFRCFYWERLKVANDDDDVILLQYFSMSASANTLVSRWLALIPETDSEPQYQTQRALTVRNKDGSNTSWLHDSQRPHQLEKFAHITVIFPTVPTFRRAPCWSPNSVATSLTSQLWTVHTHVHWCALIYVSEFVLCIFFLNHHMDGWCDL